MSFELVASLLLLGLLWCVVGIYAYGSYRFRKAQRLALTRKG